MLGTKEVYTQTAIKVERFIGMSDTTPPNQTDISCTYQTPCSFQLGSAQHQPSRNLNAGTPT